MNPELSERTELPDSVVFVNNSRETFTSTVSGAIATCLWELCRVAASEGWTPTVVTATVDAEPYPWERTHFVPSPRVPEGGVALKVLRLVRRWTGWARVGQWSYGRKVVRALVKLEPSLIVCNNDPELAVYLRRRFSEARVVHWFHNLERSSDRFRRKYSADRSLTSVAVSAYLARAVEAAYELPPLSVAVARNGVDPRAFSAAEAGVPVLEHPLPVIGFVGRICVEKAPETLLRACLLLAGEGRRFAVQLVGDTNWGRSEPTETRAVVERLTDELTARGIRVERLGHLARGSVPAAIRASDIHVVPSRWDEPCALTVLEGLACGVPVVASAAGGSPELVGEAGVLFPRDDVAALSRVLGRLLDDPGTRARLGREGRLRAETFTWAATLHALTGSAQSGGPDGEG